MFQGFSSAKTLPLLPVPVTHSLTQSGLNTQTQLVRTRNNEFQFHGVPGLNKTEDAAAETNLNNQQ